MHCQTLEVSIGDPHLVKKLGTHTLKLRPSKHTTQTGMVSFSPTFLHPHTDGQSCVCLFVSVCACVHILKNIMTRDELYELKSLKETPFFFFS